MLLSQKRQQSSGYGTNSTALRIIFCAKAGNLGVRSRVRHRATGCSWHGSSIKKEFRVEGRRTCVTQFPRVCFLRAFTPIHFPFLGGTRTCMIDCFFWAQFSDTRSTPNTVRHPRFPRVTPLPLCASLCFLFPVRSFHEEDFSIL